ncbi:hypothetical protein A3J13_00975 [Candidatus Daviesbacteria bacterium RIFCSPLOWO2_02_FULL_36_8]|uniref:Dockerin domain-containing protein n=1 Tax=Candidatus Daviesbacteria bacterium RIFCSPLOWO2_02_FULL_36_8 TaxID=1797793 RepID=A0A1F5MFN7_9BACT|nr:MAG: hypothetical protein A3J13_00975 [Candidatus Daviesbacteria bacterium RIFCSPLOWO2_02_FULL_36_8]
MFDSLKARLLLGLYAFLLISIPIGAYLTSQAQDIKSKAAETKKTITKLTPKTASSSAREILNASETNIDDLSNQLDGVSDSSSPTVATSFGPTLSLKASLEGRPANNQATKLFVGIVEGTLSSNPKFLLSFSVDLPATGEYSNLSLAGLTTGSTYTALLKGASQIATSSAFTMSPSATNLNGGSALNMLSGDLNEDNVINTSDYSIVQKAYGASSSSSNWNSLADLNADGVINTFDLGIVVKNLNQTGASGAWTSPIPASSSASLTTGGRASYTTVPKGGPQQNGYWIYIPK